MKIRLFTLFLLMIIALSSCGDTKEDEPKPVETPKQTVEQIKAILVANTWEAISLKENGKETLDTTPDGLKTYLWVFRKDGTFTGIFEYGAASVGYLHLNWSVDADEPALIITSRWRISELTDTSLKVETINVQGVVFKYDFITKK